MRKSRYAYTAALVAGFLAGGALIMSPRNVRAEDNGIGRTPVLGWSTWSFLRKEPTAEKSKLRRTRWGSGLHELGYTYINLDDFWYSADPQGPGVDPMAAG